MIRDIEIKKQARVRNVPFSTIERDIAQIFLLNELRTFDMAFKGGTCLQKIYFDNYRFSDDLDFTLMKPIDPDELEHSLKGVAHSVSDGSGIGFEFNEFKMVKNGFTGKFEFRMVWTRGSPVKV